MSLSNTAEKKPKSNTKKRDIKRALTDLAITKLQPKDKSYYVSDERGLYIEVYPNGTKAWRFRSAVGGKQILKSLGTYPEFSLAEARIKCEEMRKKVAHGEELKEKKLIIFAEMANEWLDNRIRPDKALSYIESIEQRLKNHIFPAIGDKPLTEITPPVVLEMCRKIEATGHLETAMRCKQVIGQVFKYAIAMGKAESEPTTILSGALKKRKSKKFARLTDRKMIAILMNLMKEYPILITRYALLFSALTFCRPGEVRHAEWSEIDSINNEWIIPAEKMKMRREHIVPLSTQTLDVLKKLEPLTGKYKWLFPSSRNDGSPMSENTIRMAIRAMGFGKDDMTAHGFRGMASTILNGVRKPDRSRMWDKDEIEMQLAHTEENKSRDAYNSAEYLPQRHEMMQWYADYLYSL